MTTAKILLKSSYNNVRILTMNNPKKLNAWTMHMLNELAESFKESESDENIKVLVLTGCGSYYCAGVDLSGMLKPAHPQRVLDTIKEQNQKMFELFLNYSKPILVAVNGPAIGASVTSASLCDGIIASSTATFSTPFAKLGIPPEGCSSVHFERVMDPATARAMLYENKTLDAAEALRAGLVQSVHPAGELSAAAQSIAEQWVAEGRQRQVSKDLWDVNRRESAALASAFLSRKFLAQQSSFLMSRGRYSASIVFALLSVTQPIWKYLLKKESR